MSKELAKTYDPKGIEERLYQKWMDNGYFHAKVNPDQTLEEMRQDGTTLKIVGKYLDDPEKYLEVDDLGY